MKLLKLDHILEFGKHKGKTLNHVIEYDPQYVEWCCININGFNLSKSAKQKLKDMEHNDLYDYDDWIEFEDFINY